MTVLCVTGRFSYKIVTHNRYTISETCLVLTLHKYRLLTEFVVTSTICRLIGGHVSKQCEEIDREWYASK